MIGVIELATLVFLARIPRLPIHSENIRVIFRMIEALKLQTAASTRFPSILSPLLSLLWCSESLQSRPVWITLEIDHGTGFLGLEVVVFTPVFTTAHFDPHPI